MEHISLDAISSLAINIRPYIQLMANDSHPYPISDGILISGIVNLTFITMLATKLIRVHFQSNNLLVFLF
jgi:hypothetical protein